MATRVAYLQWQRKVSLSVVDSVVERLTPPHGIRVVELEEVHSCARVSVTASVNLLVTVAPVHWDDHGLRRAAAGALPWAGA